jgi:hypothetical protein
MPHLEAGRLVKLTVLAAKVIIRGFAKGLAHRKISALTIGNANDMSGKQWVGPN